MACNKNLSEIREQRDLPAVAIRRAAESQYQRGDLQKAEHSVRVALEENPKDAEGLLLLSKICRATGRMEEAVDSAEQAYAVDESRSRYLLINLQMEQAEKSENDDLRLEHLNRLLEAVPDCERAEKGRRLGRSGCSAPATPSEEAKFSWLRRTIAQECCLGQMRKVKPQRMIC